MNLRTKFFAAGMLLASAGLAQTNTDTSVDKDPVDTVAPIHSRKIDFNPFKNHNESAKNGKLIVSPFLLPGYAPDIKFSVAAGAVISFSTNKADTLLPRSSVPVTVTYSSINSFIASAGFTTFWLHDKLRVNAILQYKVTHDAYYGVGYQSAISTPFPDSTGFWRGFFIFQLRPLWQLKKHLFTGVSLEYSSNILWQVNPHIKKDPYYQEYGPHIFNTGVGGIISYDTRDYPQNPYRGVYSSLIYTMYAKSFGGNTSFQTLDLDNRFFIPLSTNKIRTLAINLRSRYDFGDPPFTSLISLGNSTDLRGIHFGQFRDYYMNYGIAEYRQKLYFGNVKPSPFGYVLWGGVGAIGSDFGNAMFKQPLSDVGVGLRYEVQPRLNLRIDLGFALGRAGNRNATYFNFLEAY